MELSLDYLPQIKFILDGIAFALLIYFCIKAYKTYDTYYHWQQTGYEDLDIDYLEQHPDLYEVAATILGNCYPGYVLNNDEKRSSFWNSIRWKGANAVILFTTFTYLGYFVLAAASLMSLAIGIAMFRQGLFCITKENESRVRAILGY